MGDRARAEGQVILVDDNSQRRQEFGIILDFLGENPVLLDSEEWREFRAADQPAAPISAVVLGCGSGAPLTERVAEGRDWNPGVPVLLLGGHGQIGRASGRGRGGVAGGWARIKRDRG